MLAKSHCRQHSGYHMCWALLAAMLAAASSHSKLESCQPANKPAAVDSDRDLTDCMSLSEGREVERRKQGGTVPTVTTVYNRDAG